MDKVRAEDLSAAYDKLVERNGADFRPTTAAILKEAKLVKMDKEVKAAKQEIKDIEIALAEPYELPGGPANAVRLYSAVMARAEAAGNMDRVHVVRQKLAQIVSAKSVSLEDRRRMAEWDTWDRDGNLI